MIDRRELFESMTRVDVHQRSIDDVINTLEELKKECKSDEELKKYYNTRLLFELDGEDRICLELYGYRMESDEEFETRKKERESYEREYSEELLEKDKQDYARLIEKYPDGIPK